MSATGMSDSMLGFVAIYGETLKEMQQSEKKLEEKLDPPKAITTALGRKWEILIYQNRIHFFMASAAWNGVRNLPIVIKVIFAVVTAFLAIGDLFLNLFSLTIGNGMKFVINMAIPKSSIITSDEKQALARAREEVSSLERELKNVRSLIARTQKIKEEKDQKTRLELRQKQLELNEALSEEHKQCEELERINTVLLPPIQSRIQEEEPHVLPVRKELQAKTAELAMLHSAFDGKEHYQQGSVRGTLWNFVMPRLPIFGNNYYGFRREQLVRQVGSKQVEETHEERLLREIRDLRRELDAHESKYTDACQERDGLLEAQERLQSQLEITRKTIARLRD